MRRPFAVLMSSPSLGGSLTALPVAFAASAATAKCAGEKATIVGTPGAPGALRGTSGRDVIVTNGQLRTNSDRGRDLICVTGRGRQAIVAGEGNDQVLVPKDRQLGIEVWPGDGNDLVQGGAARDVINQKGEHGTDTLSLRAGNDDVFYWDDPNDSDYRDADRVYFGGGTGLRAEVQQAPRFPLTAPSSPADPVATKFC